MGIVFFGFLSRQIAAIMPEIVSQGVTLKSSHVKIMCVISIYA